jgi:hypothetical protein
VLERCCACGKRIYGRPLNAVIGKLFTKDVLGLSIHREYVCVTMFYKYIKEREVTAAIIHDTIVELYERGVYSRSEPRNKAPLWKRFIGKFISKE